MDEGVRARLRATYHAAVCEVEADGGWEPLTALPPPHAAGLVLTAWNPGSRALPAAVNRARDALLRAELAALELAPLRARGRDAAATWIEDGWLIPHVHARSLQLLRRYEQVAGYVFAARGRGLLWSDGTEESLDAGTGG